ncbi:ribokinase [Nakamurella antarctica]|uniref:Ribokinase n=1 Tax=Nakamurella antarctica TaxID=1902245 RepID=A0A3G8ZUH9_9ACTN|nr:PfkB family carbohydrate kinase [Nakamurella antarctica]AZI57686.1 ribokinase [Nakamurella antarctica]
MSASAVPATQPNRAGDSPRVTVIGDVGLDVVAKLSGAVVFGQDTRAAVTVTPGGAGGNTAAWLARYGVDVSLIARVGDDEAGRTAAAELTAADITCLFAVDQALPTCCVVVLVALDGERTMLPDRGANRALSPEDVVLPDSDQRQHLHLSGYVLLDEQSRPAGLAALAKAKAAGWTTSVDPQSATHIAGVGAANFLSWIEGTDLLLPNDTELAVLGGVDAALEVARCVVVTHGFHGASWYSAEHRINVPAPAVHETDSTGAGDAFNAGLLSSWLTGGGELASLEAGVRAGSAAAATIGARPKN